MTLRHCPNEPEVAAALRAGRWPTGSDAALVAHAAVCRVCGPLARAGLALRQLEAGATVFAPPPPAPGTLWWRAQLQRRQQALAQAARPLVLAPWIALAAVLAAACALALASRSSLAVAWQQWTAQAAHTATLVRAAAWLFPAFALACIGVAAAAATAYWWLADPRRPRL